MSALEKWIKKTVGNDTDNAISVKAGIPSATLWRQMPDKLTPENVVKIARAYQVSVIDGLLAQGLLHPADVEDSAARDAIENASDRVLMEELGRRVADGRDSDLYDVPVSQVFDITNDVESLPHAAYPVTELPEDHTP